MISSSRCLDRDFLRWRVKERATCGRDTAVRIISEHTMADPRMTKEKVEVMMW